MVLAWVEGSESRLKPDPILFGLKGLDEDEAARRREAALGAGRWRRAGSMSSDEKRGRREDKGRG